jgi:hypothetical protein
METNPPQKKSANSKQHNAKTPECSVVFSCGKLCFFYRVQDEHHETIKADGSVNNLAEAVELILKFNNPTT